MTTEPESPEVVDEVVEPTPKKKPVKRKPTAKKPRAKKKPEPAPAPLTGEEVKETLIQAKAEFKDAVVEPVKSVIGSYSQMARDGLAGLVGGFLGNKRRD